jgi:hypothetical protein
VRVGGGGGETSIVLGSLERARYVFYGKSEPQSLDNLCCYKYSYINKRETWLRNIGQGEAQHRKYKRLKLGGGQAYDRSSD